MYSAHCFDKTCDICVCAKAICVCVHVFVWKHLSFNKLQNISSISLFPRRFIVVLAVIYQSFMRLGTVTILLLHIIYTLSYRNTHHTQPHKRTFWWHLHIKLSIGSCDAYVHGYTLYNVWSDGGRTDTVNGPWDGRLYLHMQCSVYCHPHRVCYLKAWRCHVGTSRCRNAIRTYICGLNHIQPSWDHEWSIFTTAKCDLLSLRCGERAICSLIAGSWCHI